jgi:hypothetical protein
MEGWEELNLSRCNWRVAKEHTHTHQKQQKAGITTNLSILTLNANSVNSYIKRHRLMNWIRKEDLTIHCLQETHLINKNKHLAYTERMEKEFPSKWTPQTSRSIYTYIS